MVNAEYRRRVLDTDDHRSKSIFCLNFARNLAGKISVVKIGKYIDEMKKFEEAGEINFTVPLACTPVVTLRTNKLYISGETINDETSEAVST